MNDKRMISCMKRAQQKEPLTIGFLGGSITQGSLASSQEYTYVARVCRWWQDTFPKTSFHCINAGIGGTSSHFGVARAEEDLLSYHPDLVIIDFSVNDEPDEFFMETFEGLLRKIISWPSNPAVLVLNNIYYDTGKTAEDFHNRPAAHYHIPWISIRDTVYKKMCQGMYEREALTPDGLHPGDMGHKLLAEEITAYLEAVRKQAEGSEEIFGSLDAKLPPPLTQNAYQNAIRLNQSNSTPGLYGFCAHEEEKNGYPDLFRNGWVGSRKGDGICLFAECGCLAVQYRKTIAGTACIAQIVLDDDEENPVVLDGNFEERWGDCLYLQKILHHEKRALRKIRIVIVKEGEIPFYLAGLIIA